MDKSTIHTVAIVISILGCFWILSDKITENRIVLAEMKGALQAHIDGHVHMRVAAAPEQTAQ